MIPRKLLNFFSVNLIEHTHQVTSKSANTLGVKFVPRQDDFVCNVPLYFIFQGHQKASVSSFILISAFIVCKHFQEKTVKLCISQAKEKKVPVFICLGESQNIFSILVLQWKLIYLIWEFQAKIRK